MFSFLLLMSTKQSLEFASSIVQILGRKGTESLANKMLGAANVLAKILSKSCRAIFGPISHVIKLKHEALC